MDQLKTPPQSTNTILQGDCLKLFRKLGNAEVDLVFADPPFNIGYTYDVYEDQRGADDYLQWCGKWIAEIRRVLKPNGSFWLAIGDEFAAELKIIAQKEAGFVCRSWVIWYYTFGVNCLRGFSRSHTHLFHFVCDPSNFVFNGDNPATRIPSARQLVYADNRANPRGRLPDNTWIFRPQDAPPGSFSPWHDTWYMARVAGTFKEREGFHGCQMPEQLLGRIIRISSNPRDLVLDPFGGSGTTLTVAKKLGRRFLGFELSKSYVTHIKARLAAARPGDPLDGPADPLQSAPATKKGRARGRMTNGRLVFDIDERTEQGLIEAYRNECGNESTDFVLCHPDANATFVDACKKKGLEGNAYAWNHALLGLRKAGKLSSDTRVTKKRRIGVAEMDAYSFASEIAMQTFWLNYGLTIDDLLCDPTYASEFDRAAAEFAPGQSSFEYRWAAMSIRKRANAATQLADEHFSQWQLSELPPANPLCDITPELTMKSGVYLLRNVADELLYVGEALDVSRRVALVQDATTPWHQIGVHSIQFVEHAIPSLLPGLQARIVRQSSHEGSPSFLNSELLAKSPS